MPLIIVSGTIGEERAVEAMREGAADFVLKDHLARLAPAVEREVREAKNRRDQRAAQTRFSRLVESGVIGVAIADGLGNIIEANDAYLAMLGYAREDLLSGHVRWTDMTPPEWRDGDARAVEQLTATGVARPWEKELLRKDGTRATVLVGAALLDSVTSIAFTVDVSERKKAEVALRRTQEQLLQTQKMEAIGLLAGGVAHDFNNLLTVILSYSEMITRDLDEGDPLRADMGEIKLAGQRAAALTRQLLAFSRQQVTAPTVLDLNTVIQDMHKMLKRLIREDIELTTVAAPNLGRCHADPGQVEQVLMNLVVNARDAMPSGGTLTLETANVELDPEYAASHVGVKAGPYVMLAVSDTGTGMDKATQARIFEPFFTTKPKGQGTGLGLSTVFGIVEQSKGHVWVYSEPGHGSSFKVYLPRTDETEAAAPKAFINPRGTETILLVEDEDQIRNVALAILKRHGYRVIEARNAGEALLTCEQHPEPIHLVLTDVVMPQMSGKQLADRLGLVRPGLKVLFMSGYTDGALVHELAAGAAFLQKPLTPGSLTRKVRDVLDAG
ncbi:MAG: response regulator [Archangiaceae bacterium]|nr:response regulator [Archangiaceae bacterium]